MARFCLYALFVLVSTSAPGWGAEGKSCKDKKPKPVEINIELELPNPVYDLSQSLRQINEDRSGLDAWITRNGMQKVWSSKEMAKLGYADGGAALMSHVQMLGHHYDRYGIYYCTYVTKFDVAMMFRTRIIIPNNFKKGGCRFNHIHAHELRHYQTNRDTALAFVKRLNHDLAVIVSEIENRQPYVQRSEVPKAFERMKAEIAAAIEVYIVDAMGAALTRENDKIDTPEEYASSGPKLKACKD